MKFLATACFIASSLALVNGQSPATTTSFGDRLRLCKAHEQSAAIFVGRALEPVTFHVSGEAWIEEARRNVERTKEEVARLRSSLDPQAIEQMETEFVIRVLRAESELMDRRGRAGSPFDMTFVPVQVERALRGVTESTLMVEMRAGASTALQSGELYLIAGDKRKDSMPFPRGMPDPFGFNEYVILARATPIASAQEDLRFLASTASGATILGRIARARPDNGRSAPMGGTRIIVSSDGHPLDVITVEDGTFTVSGLQPGRVEIRPLLPEDLTVLNRSSLSFDVGEGGCRTAELKVELNGRIRGRVISATSTPLEDVEVVLQAAPDGVSSVSSSDDRTTIKPNADGTYEFFGQRPGSYFLSTQVRVEDGKNRYSVTYYPGTNDITQALPIVIGHATLHEGFDFLVKTE